LGRRDIPFSPFAGKLIEKQFSIDELEDVNFIFGPLNFTLYLDM